MRKLKSLITGSTILSFTTMMASLPDFPPAMAQSSNGCGDDSTAVLLSVLAPISARQFKVACNEHDSCYDTLGKSREDCDTAFLRRMEGICRSDHNTIVGYPLQLKCLGRANTFYRVVRERSHSAYDEAQRQAKIRAGQAAPAPSPISPHSTISFKNNCPRPVQIAVHFYNPVNQWQTKAWYSFTPNEGPARLDGISTRNRHIYYYAETTDGSNLVWSGNLSQYVNDRLYNFQAIDTGPSIVRWTQTLNCPYAHRIFPPNSGTLVASHSPEVYLLTQATSKQPTANQLPPDEQPAIVPDAQQTQEDQPKVAPTQAAPGANSTKIPAKRGTDAAEPDPTEPPQDSPNPSPTTNPTNSPTNAVPETVPSPQNMPPMPGMSNTPESPTLNSPAPTPAAPPSLNK